MVATLFIANAANAQTTQPTSRPALRVATQPATLSVADQFTLTLTREFEVDRRQTLVQLGESPTADLRVRTDDASRAVVELRTHQRLLERATNGQMSVRLLPEQSRTAERFGVVQVDHAILRQSIARPTSDRDNVSDLTRGEPVWILDRDGDALFVHSSDGYLGWVDASAVEAVPAEKFKACLNADPTPASIEKVIAHAKTFLGTPYVWGGKTGQGIDCSGLTQVSYAEQGVLLPRDADQQAKTGQLVATRYFTEALRPGDLLFFVSARRGNVSHVALYVGDGQYIQAANGGVRISSLRASDPNYDADRAETLTWGRRVVRSEN